MRGRSYTPLMTDATRLRPPYGLSNFALLREEGYLYVDKTRFIRALEARPERYLLYLRPRRFGKSLWLSVLRHYYDIRLREGWEELFAGLEIGENPTDERSSAMMLHFNFSGIDADSVEKAAEGMRLAVANAVSIMIEDYGLSSRSTLERLMDLPNAASTLEAGLKLARDAATPVHVLIDEYDHFTNELLTRSTSDFSTAVERGGFVRKFYEALKKGTETVVRRVFITGVTPVTLDSLTSGFNIAANVTLKPDLHEMMGFTHDEVRALLARDETMGEARRREVFDELEEWYDGYRFAPGRPRLFNPDMVLYYLANRDADGSPPDEMLDTNVASDYRTIERTVKLGRGEGPPLLDELTDQRSLSVKLTRQYSLSRGFGRDDVASLLFYLGLLTVDDAELDGLRLRVPNKVINELFWDTVRVIHSDRAGFGVDPSEIRHAVVDLARDGELAPLASLVEQYLTKLLSNRDLRGFRERELQIAFLMLLHAPRLYLIKSERELERGYADIMLLRRPGVDAPYEHVIELKYLKTGATDKELALAADEAREQIAKYLETDELRHNPRLLAWAVVFRGAKCELLERSGPAAPRLEA
jgi:hypothetical protein